MASEDTRHARMRGLSFLGYQDAARARCDIGFESDGNWFSVSVPLLDAVQFCSYVDAVQSRSKHGPLRYLCSAAIDATGPAQWAAREALRRISRRVDVVGRDRLLARCWDRAITNDLAIAVGGGLHPACSVPVVGQALNHDLNIGWRARDAASYFERWNDFLDHAEKKAGRLAVHQYIHAHLQRFTPTDLHRAIASLPVSNFIDATLDRSLTKALIATGKRPIVEDETSFQIGSWKETEVATPHVFNVMGQPHPTGGFGSPRSLIRDSQSLQIENIGEMLSRKDLLLLDFSAWEAEAILGLSSFAADVGKIINCIRKIDDPMYWARLGVAISPHGVEEFLDGLRPAVGMRYGELDVLVPTEQYIEMSRKKPHDCFISYSRVDANLVEKLDRALQLRRFRVWRDVQRVEAGSPIAATLDAELGKSYCFIVVLTPESLTSDWVQHEIASAVELHRRGELTIIPVLFRNCAIPESIQEFDFVDLRDEELFEHGIARLTGALRNAARRAVGKLRIE